MIKHFTYSAAILAGMTASASVAQTNNAPLYDNSPEYSPHVDYRPPLDANGYDAAWYNFPANSAANTHFNLDFKGSILGFPLISGKYEGALDNGRYNVRTLLRTSGLGALVKKLRIWSVTKGTYNGSGLYPLSHTQQNQDKKGRRVEMIYDYDAGQVNSRIYPHISSKGTPPASQKEKFAADDAVSAVLNLMARQTSGQNAHLDAPLCTGDVRVFDSKQHYALRMVKGGTDKKKFFGKTTDIIECQIYYVPISGFDPEDLPSKNEGSTPINAQMMKNEELGIYVPIRMSYKISGFTAVIKITDMQVNGRSLNQ